MGKENKSRYAIMGMLSLGPMSGYELKKNMEISTSNFWKESYGQIYPMLKQLEREGLTTSYAEKQEGRPDRYIHTLTDKGEAELRSWLAEPSEPMPQRSELLLKLFFGKQIPLPAAIAHVQRHKELHLQLLQRYEETERFIADQFAGSANLPYWLITMRYGRSVTQAALAWCDETLTAMQELAQQEVLHSHG